MDFLPHIKKSDEHKADSKEKLREKLEQATKEKPLTKTSEEDLAHYGFKIGKVLGEGSYSAVRFATYKGREIAVKVINREKISQDFTSKFLPREIEVLSKIKHKNIIHVFKIFNYPRKVYIFMEYLERGDLLTYVRKKGYLSEKKTRHYFKQLLAALQYLHGLNIAHRDLKCENIMLDDEDNIRLIDFGFCRSTVSGSGRRLLSQTYCGSTAYAAPEVLQGTPYNPMLYDVWSLGCVLFIMVTGSMPFDDSNVRKMVEYQIKRKLKFPAGRPINSDVKVDLCMSRKNIIPVKEAGTIACNSHVDKDTLQRVDDCIYATNLAFNGFYILEEELGVGNYGKVKKAMLGEKFLAVKIINREKMPSDLSNKFLSREVAILKEISHENIVQIHRIFEFHRKVYIFMELIVGTNLREYITERPLVKETECRLVFRQIASAVKYLHDRCIAHRDLKCENIMITADNVIKIIDFGFAKKTDRSRDFSNTFCGSLAYTAPEVLMGVPYNSFQHDIWSLGCILFVMAFGVFPFHDEDVVRVVEAQLNKVIDYPPTFQITSSFKGLIERMLEPDVETRITIHEVITDDWLQENDNPIRPMMLTTKNPQFTHGFFIQTQPTNTDDYYFQAPAPSTLGEKEEISDLYITPSSSESQHICENCI